MGELRQQNEQAKKLVIGGRIDGSLVKGLAMQPGEPEFLKTYMEMLSVMVWA